MEQEKKKISAGDLVKVGNEYGMCNGLYGERVAFVTSDVRVWGSRFVKPNEDVALCEDESEIIEAKRAALTYYTLELQSINRKIKNYNEKSVDSMQTLMDAKSMCEFWIEFLK